MPSDCLPQQSPGQANAPAAFSFQLSSCQTRRRLQPLDSAVSGFDRCSTCLGLEAMGVETHAHILASKSEAGYVGVRPASNQGTLKYPDISSFQGRSHLVNRRPAELSPYIQHTPKEREREQAQGSSGDDKPRSEGKMAVR